VATRDALGGLLLLLFGVATAVLSLQLPLGTFRAAGSGLFPLCLGLLLALLAGLYLLHLRVQAARSHADPPHAERPAMGRLACFLSAVAAATLLLTPLGFPLTAFLLMVALLRTLEFRRWSGNLLISLLTALVAHLLFVQWLRIPLPKGWIGL
jgi:hypothetical protein